MTEFNDTSTPSRFLQTRRSGKARDMTGAGPDAGQLDEILTAASRVPDHGKLAPWRFVVIPQEAREAFAALLEKAYLTDKPEAGKLEMKAVRDFATQAPTLVTVLSKPNPESHIPVWEQELSAGAACYNLVAAATAMGFRGSWLTGWAAYSKVVLDAIGEPGERVAGFIFVGASDKPLDERPRPTLDQVVRVWQG